MAGLWEGNCVHGSHAKSCRFVRIYEGRGAGEVKKWLHAMLMVKIVVPLKSWQSLSIHDNCEVNAWLAGVFKSKLILGS